MKRAFVMAMLLAMPAYADDHEPSAADVANAPLPGNESGRMDPAEHDSLLRDIGQGVLVPPRVVVEVTMAPVRATVWALDRYRLIDRWKQWFFDDTETYGLYPTLVLDASYGLTVGGRFVHRNLFGHREHFSARVSTGGEYRAQADAGIRTGTLLGDHVRLELRGAFERRPGDAFYGIGNSTDSMAAYHRQELVRTTTTLDLRTFDGLHLRVAGAISDINYGPSSEDPPIDMIYDPQVLTGWTGVRNVYGELELRWDRRAYTAPFDRHTLYNTGWLVCAYAGRVHQLEAGADYSRYGGEAQQFFHLGVGPRTLLARLHVDGVTGSYTDVAFTELPELGGKALLRGYPRERFRDRLAAVTSLEYTWDLGHYPVASVFVDAGRVFSGPRDIEPTHLRVGYGFSLQLHDSRRFIAGISIASSIDGGVFVDLSFDPVFDLDLEPRVEQR